MTSMSDSASIQSNCSNNHVDHVVNPSDSTGSGCQNVTNRKNGSAAKVEVTDRSQ